MLIIYYTNDTPCLIPVYVGTMLLALPKHLSSPLVFSGVRVAQSLVFCIVFCRSLFFLLKFFFGSLYCLPVLWVIVLSARSLGHCIVCPFFAIGSLYCLPFFELRPLVTPFGIFKLFFHRHSLI